MIVSVCRRVSDRDITRHALADKDFDGIQFELEVAMQCGRCEGRARERVARGAAQGSQCGCASSGQAQNEVAPWTPLPLAA